MEGGAFGGSEKLGGSEKAGAPPFAAEGAALAGAVPDGEGAGDVAVDDVDRGPEKEVEASDERSGGESLEESGRPASCASLATRAVKSSEADGGAGGRGGATGFAVVGAGGGTAAVGTGGAGEVATALEPADSVSRDGAAGGGTEAATGGDATEAAGLSGRFEAEPKAAGGGVAGCTGACGTGTSGVCATGAAPAASCIACA